MKTKSIFAVIIILMSFLSCSKESLDEKEEPFTICFIVKDKTTSQALSDVEITVMKMYGGCAWGGCDIKYEYFGPEFTDSNGKACIDADPNGYHFYCSKDGYKSIESSVPNDVYDHKYSDLQQIFLEPLTE